MTVLANVFQVGDSGGLHYNSSSALGQSEAVHREHWCPGSGGQGAGPGESTDVHCMFSSIRLDFSCVIKS